MFSITLGCSTIFGVTARIFAPKFAFAKYSSSICDSLKFSAIAAEFSPTSADISRVIRSISACSRAFSTRISLLASTTLIGSIKNVCPVAEVS